MHQNHLVIGAGVAGLTCARALSRAGHEVLVIDKARGVGGRCATTHVEGQAIDFGPVFLHGSDEAFIEELQSIPSVTLLEDWPRRRRGAGKPCQYDAFLPTERRFAIAEGVSRFPKHLAEGLNVRLDTRATKVTLEEGSWTVEVDGGEPLKAPSLIMAMPVEQTLAFVWPLVGHSEELEAVAMLLDMVPSLPSLTVMAGYGLDAPTPAWDVYYPETKPGLLMIAHDSSKRTEPRFRTLVLQASARWSRAHLEEPSENWTASLLEEAADVMGSWVGSPVWTRSHRWRYSRVDRGNELTGPVRVALPTGATIGLAGDVFAPGGGIEAAYNAGRTLAGRLLQKDEGHE